MSAPSQTSTMHATPEHEGRAVRRFLTWSIGFILLHIVFMFFRYGRLPSAPLVPDEVIINDAALSIAHGHGFVSESLAQSKYGLDHVYAHFPPVYPYLESIAFRVMGVSVYSLRMTTTLMSILSTILLMLVVWRFCRSGWLSWTAGILVNALFCTNGPLISAERMARMESTISVLVMLAALAIAMALTVDEGKPRWPWTLAAAFFTAGTLSVHLEAVTAVIILGPILLFVVPIRPWVRAAILAVLFLVPATLALAVYRSQIVTAIYQFIAIARDSQSVNRSSYGWLVDVFTDFDISAMNRNIAVGGMMILMGFAPYAAWRSRNREEADPILRRFRLWFAVGCTIDFILMIVLLRMDEKRCLFLFGLLLLGNAIALSGSRAPRRNWKIFAWSVIVLQTAAACFYVSERAKRIPEMNADRYLPVLKRIPPGVSVGATPGLWLDFEELHRPFTLIMYGMDGEQNWGKQNANPLAQFDIVILENYYGEGRVWLSDEASEGRTSESFLIGRHIVTVYTRPNARLLPPDPAAAPPTP